MSDTNPLRAIVEEVRRENEAEYGTEAAEATIRTAIQRAFQPWSYVFELVQNAIDAKASRIRIRTSESGAVFEHDGLHAFDGDAIRAVSRLGRSTKRLDTVGFMGVGFKAVFARFQHVEIADAGVRIAFHLGFEVRPGGAKLTRFIDTVLPTWNENGPGPSPTYTTRIGLSGLLGGGTPGGDTAHLVDAEAPHALAILGLRGLKELDLDGAIWNIEHHADHREVSAEVGGRRFRWLYVDRTYHPSEAAFNELIEFRHVRLTLEETKHELSRGRSVIAFVPLDDERIPMLPENGLVYATLPTGEHIPLRMFLQADWFLNITREHMLNVERSPWHSEIVAQIPDLVTDLVRAFVERGEEEARTLQAGLRILEIGEPDASLETLNSVLTRDAFKTALAAALRSIAFLPAHADGELAFETPAGVVQPAWELMVAFSGRPDLRADLIFGGPVLDAALVPKEVARALLSLKLTHRLEPADLAARWPSHLEAWWRTASLPGVDCAADARGDVSDGEPRAANPFVVALLRMLAGIEHHHRDEPAAGWRSLPCVPTEAGTFCKMTELRRYAGNAPSEGEPGAAIIFRDLAGFLLKPSERMVDVIASSLPQPRSSLHRAAADSARTLRDWFEVEASPVEVPALLARAIETLDADGACTPDIVVAVTAFARNRNQPRIVPRVVVTKAGADLVANLTDAVVAEPYAETGDIRRALFHHLAPVSSAYLLDDISGARAWATVFEQDLQLSGPVRLRQRVVRNGIADIEEAGREIKRDYGALHAANKRGYTVMEHVFEFALDETTAPHLARWLEAGHTALQGKGHRWVTCENRGRQPDVHGSVVCAWVEDLAKLAWVPTRAGTLARPAGVAIDGDDHEDALLATISRPLVDTLAREGLVFGGEVPRADVVRRVLARGSVLAAPELAALLEEARDDVASGRLDVGELRRALLDVALPRKGGLSRVPASRVARRVGQGVRGSLGDWVVELGALDAAVANALTRLGSTAFDPPPTTTGRQALSFLRSVWGQARDGSRLVTDDLRAHLPNAYVYVLEDAAADAELQTAWQSARMDARLYSYAKRAWLGVAGDPPLAVNDLPDPRFEEYIERSIVTVTPGHLGQTREQIAATAGALGVPLVSELLQPEWTTGTPIEPAWLPMLGILCAELAKLDNRSAMTVRAYDKLTLKIGKRTEAAYAYGEDTTLNVTTNPSRFVQEAAEAIVAHYNLGQRGAAIPSLMGALGALQTPAAFERSLRRLRHQLGIPQPEADETPVVTSAPVPSSTAVGEVDETNDAASEENVPAVQPSAGKLPNNSLDGFVKRLNERLNQMNATPPATTGGAPPMDTADPSTPQEAPPTGAASADPPGPPPARAPRAAPPPINPLGIVAVDVTTGTAAPPAAPRGGGGGRGSSWYAGSEGGKDWAESDEAKRAVGLRGEEAVVESERLRVSALGFDPARVVWHAKRVVDAPYDIESVDGDGQRFFIEVKATVGADEGAEFEISVNELLFAFAHADRYAVYRVVDANAEAPRIFRHRNLKKLLDEGRAQFELASAKLRLPRAG